jgi:hypothetical protein
MPRAIPSALPGVTLADYRVCDVLDAVAAPWLPLGIEHVPGMLYGEESTTGKPLEIVQRH